MAVIIGNAKQDEQGRISGGQAGDQTGKEVCSHGWVDKGWNKMIRPKNSMVAEKIARAMEISRKCIRIVKQNIRFAIGVKILCLILGALGIANMWMAIFADVGVMIIAVLNAIRILFIKK